MLLVVKLQTLVVNVSFFLEGVMFPKLCLRACQRLHTQIPADDDRNVIFETQEEKCENRQS